MVKLLKQLPILVAFIAGSIISITVTAQPVIVLAVKQQLIGENLNRAKDHSH